MTIEEEDIGKIEKPPKNIYILINNKQIGYVNKNVLFRFRAAVIALIVVVILLLFLYFTK